MGRPADWLPLCDSDPVPGDPAAVAGLGAKLQKAATAITQQANYLKNLCQDTFWWDSEAGSAFRATVHDTGDKLARCFHRYDTAARALGTGYEAAAAGGYAHQLWYAQTVLADRGWRQARDAETARAAAFRAILAANGGADPLVAPPPGGSSGSGTPKSPAYQGPVPPPASPGVIPDRLPPFTGDPADVAAYKRQYNNAVDELSAAVHLVQKAQWHRDTAAHAAASMINSVIGSDGLKDSYWDRFKHWVTAHASVIREIANVAGWIATACGLLSLVVGWIPIVGWGLAAALDTIATLATAVSLVCHFMLWITGNGSWVDVGLDLFALATFGMGRIYAKTAEEGYTVARAAARTPLVREIGKGAGDLSKAELTQAANKITGFAAKDAKAAITSAKSGLRLPGWADAGLKGLSPRLIAKDVWGAISPAEKWPGTEFSVGDAAVKLAEEKFGKVVAAFPKIEKLPSVARWTSIASAARFRFYASTAAGTVVDGFDKASQVEPPWPVLRQWNQAKGEGPR